MYKIFDFRQILLYNDVAILRRPTILDEDDSNRLKDILGFKLDDFYLMAIFVEFSISRRVEGTYNVLHYYLFLVKKNRKFYY